MARPMMWLVVLACCLTASAVQTSVSTRTKGWSTAFAELASRVAVDPAPVAAAAATNPLKSINGKVKLNGVVYQTSCHCTEDETATQESLCLSPVKLRVRQESFNHERGLSKDALYTLLGTPETVSMVDSQETSFSCVEGREHNAVLGTPGGDFGEFLLALNAFEKFADIMLDDPAVLTLFRAWLNYEGRGTAPFYYHTDETAIMSLQQKLHVNGRTGTLVGLQLDAPGGELQAELLKDLVKSVNQGCYFIKSVLDSPSSFYMRPELAPALIRAFYTVLWNRDDLANDGDLLSNKINFVVFEEHDDNNAEKAWINFRANQHCETEHIAPSFRPKTDDVSVFVNHPYAVDSLRGRMARFFALHASDVNYKDLQARFRRGGEQAMEVVAETVGSRVPFYTVVVE